MSMLTSESLNPNLVEDDPYNLSFISKEERQNMNKSQIRLTDLKAAQH